MDTPIYPHPQCTAGTECKLLSFADDTKFMRRITHSNDIMELQGVIDRACKWFRDNKIILNTAKTYHVSYARTIQRKITTLYFIGTEEIETKTEMRDLGILFDNKLTFKAHATLIEARTRAMKGAAFRFGTDINNRGSILIVAKAYIVPIIEYGSIIWRNDTQIQNYAMENTLRFATRVTLRAPYDNRDPLYIPYEVRLRMLDLLSLRERFIIANVIFAIKCAKDEIDVDMAVDIKHRIIQRRIQTRRPNIFETAHLPFGSRIKRILEFANEYRDAIDLTKSITANRRQLSEYLKAVRVGTT